MRKLHAAVDRFAMKHPRFGIPNLMKVIVIGNVITYLLMNFSNYSSVSFLAFNWGAVLQGEIWRVISFIFMPSATSPLLFLLSSYFIYFVGKMLEREWGTPKFNLYYFTGVALTVLVGIIGYYLPGASTVYGTYYINLSIFLAFAAIYPDTPVLVLFFPVKIKWLAYLDVAIFLLDSVTSLMRLDLLNALLPIIAMLNFLVFFWVPLMDGINYRRRRTEHQQSHKTIQFKSAIRQQQHQAAERGYRHKCAVCGRTDTEFPDLEFRYCSRCAGYHCFCQDHIFSHEHFTE